MATLASLEDLNLYRNPRLTDATAASVARLRSLRTLDLTGAALTDAGLRQLASLHRLKRLSIFETHVTDAGVAYLCVLPLEDLNLGDNRGVSDACVSRLSQMISLTQLDLTSTSITVEGLKRLRMALPQCRIEARNLPDE